MKEFIYFDKDNLSTPLGDDIYVINEIEDEACIIGNTEELNAEIFAPEIDFYLKNSQDSIIQKAKNVSLLYRARSDSFDLAKDMDFTQEVGKNVLVVGDEMEDIAQALKAEGFGVLSFKDENIESIDGHLGSLHVNLTHDGKPLEVTTDQIVWKNAPEFALKQSGILDYDIQSIDEIVKTILEKSGKYIYKNYTFYDNSICQYHERRGDICGKCADICPTVAIVKDEENKHLKFSHIDCHGCGGCISVCPSGAIDYSQMPQTSFYKIAKMYEDKIPLIIPRKMHEKVPQIPLPKDILPFAIEGEKYLHEAHLLTLLQESGSQIAFFTDFVSRGTSDAIDIINQIYKAIYGKDGILVFANKHELEEGLKNLTKIPKSKHSAYLENIPKREVFSKRLSHIVEENDFGYVTSGEHIRYGDVKVDKDKCTLCLSCVGACNVGALSANTKDFTLRLNPSICTTCGYCEVSCPESGCMEVVRGEIPLNKSWFTKRVLATDTLFECIVCHKPFATTKSVMKIATTMEPIFKGDDAKIKSLYCCGDCKPKVMLESYIKDRDL